MATNWTASQQNAIDSRNGTVLVSAAAGSGKTAVLVERIVGLLLDPVKPISIDKILAVTFTNAAAGEMRERIEKALSKQTSLNPEDSRLRRQLMLLPNAKICTIDSFCMDLVFENFHKLGIGQDYKILETGQENDMKRDVVNTVIEHFYDLEDNSDFLLLVELLSNSKNDRTVEECIEKLYTYINAHPFPIKWLDSMVEQYRVLIPVEETIWGKTIISEIHNCLNYCTALVNEAVETSKNDETVFEAFRPVLLSDKNQIELIENCKTWDIYVDLLLSYNPERNPSKRGDFTKNPYKIQVVGIRDRIKKSIKKLQEYACATECDHFEDLKLLYPAVKALGDAVKMYSSELMKRKMEINSFTFSDITHFSLNLLVEKDCETFKPTEFALELRENFEEILLDEYQDTNKAQDMLFHAIARDNNLFMVGDVKQSIYKFRQAMPQIFMEKSDSFSKYDGKTYPAKIVFDKNFRSRKEVCDFVNFTFGTLMSREVGGLEYSDEEKLSAGSAYPFPVKNPIQMHFLNMDITSENSDEIEAEYLAKLVKDKVKSGEIVNDKDLGERPIQYRDIAILLRSANKHIPNYLPVFRRHGIPVSSITDGEFFNQPEISTMMSLLSIIDNPMQDIPLLSVMMSPIYGFTVDEIAEMRIKQSKCSSHAKVALYTCVSNFSKTDEKTKQFFDSLSRMRTYCATMPTGALIRRIYDETSYVAIAKSMGNSEMRESNLNLLLKYADSFENSGSRGLSSFVRFLDKAKSNENSLSGAKNNNFDSNSVRFMSIHRSKGLEFPVCIVAGNGRKYRQQTDSGVLLNQDLGAGLKGIDKTGLYKYNTIPFMALKIAEKNAEMSELLRVQYVAMTRAKEQLIMVSTVSKLQSTVSSVAQKITNGGVLPYAVGSISSDVQLLLLIALLHKDGKELRNMVDREIQCKNSDFNIEISVVDEIQKTVEGKNEIDETFDEKIVEQISEKLSYKYPYSDLANLMAKRNASSLDEDQIDLSFFASARPAFMEKEGLSATQKGTAMHSFMQHCDYSKAQENVFMEAERLFEQGFLSENEKSALDIEKIQSFFNHKLAKRIFDSEKVMREIKFATFVDAKNIYPEINIENEKVYVQGIADCVFVENGKLVVVDYKTDHVKSEKQLLDRYKNQLMFYCHALEKTFSMPVSECVLYSFHFNKSMSYDLILKKA